MPSLIRTLVLGLPFLVVAPTAAAPVMPPSKEQISQWVTQLGDRTFAVRERAQQNLWQAGPLAEDALRKAVTESGDKEVVRRASEILDQFRWGLYPNTPKPIVDLIKEYRGGDANARLALVPRLLDQGPAGARALIKITSAEENADLKRRLFTTLSFEMGRAMPRMLAEGDHATIEALLDLSLTHQRETGLRNYVAFNLLRGKLAERITETQALQKKTPEDAQLAELLCYLHRANGDLATARKVLGRTQPDNRLQVGLLIEHGEWHEAARQYTTEGLSQVEGLGYRLSLSRLDGQGKEFENAKAELIAYGQKAERDERWFAAKALFANGLADDALKLLEGRDLVRAEILLAQGKLDEALKVLTPEGPQSGPVNQADAVAKDCLRARIEFVRGDREAAKKILDRWRTEAEKNQDVFSWVDRLMNTQVRLSLRSDAEATLLVVLEKQNQPVIPRTVWRPLFRDDGDLAAFWWQVLRKQDPKAEGAAALKKLRELLDGKLKGKELTALFEAAGENEKSAPHCLALGLVAQRGGDNPRVEKHLTQLLEVSTLTADTVRLGDWLAGKKRWKEAAEAYARGWERDRRQPLLLFLQGSALKQAGQEKDGERLMEQAHWLPLGDDRQRQMFATELARRGHPKDADREWELITRTCTVGSFTYGEARRQIALRALDRQEYLESVEGQEQAMLRLLSPSVSFLETSAFVGVPHYINRQRARGLILAGKFDEAKGAIDRCFALMPAAIEVPLELVPALESKGKQKEADELFARVLKIKRQLCKDHPKAATHYNGLGWLCAVCRRELDTGLEHAHKAVELEPENAAYRDTLAELLFQKGDKEKAVTHMKKCIELEPKRVFYRKQLKRMEAGDPRAALPPENE